MKRKQYDTYGMSGEGFAAGASAGAGPRGPFPGATYSGIYLLTYLLTDRGDQFFLHNDPCKGKGQTLVISHSS